MVWFFENRWISIHQHTFLPPGPMMDRFCSSDTHCVCNVSTVLQTWSYVISRLHISPLFHPKYIFIYFSILILKMVLAPNFRSFIDFWHTFLTEIDFIWIVHFLHIRIPWINLVNLVKYSRIDYLSRISLIPFSNTFSETKCNFSMLMSILFHCLLKETKIRKENKFDIGHWPKIL